MVNVWRTHTRCHERKTAPLPVAAKLHSITTLHLHLSKSSEIYCTRQILRLVLASSTRVTIVASAAESQPLTPRQKRLAQQRRKWEEAQRQQQQQLKPQQQRMPHTPATSLPTKHLANSSKASWDPVAALSRAEQLAEHASSSSPHPPQSSRRTADSAPGSTFQAPSPRAVRTRSTGAAGAAVSTPCDQVAAAPRRQPQPAPPSPPSPPPLLPLPHQQRQRGQSPPQDQQQAYGQQRQEQQQEHAGGWPSVFADAGGGGGVSGDGPHAALDLEDLRTLPGSQLASLARQWADELVAWAQPEGRCSPPSNATTALPSTVPPAVPDCQGTGTPVDRYPMGSSQAVAPASAQAELGVGNGGGGGATGFLGGQPSLLAARLPASAVARLAALTAAVDSHMAHGSLGHQELADLAWFVAYYDREHSMRVLAPAMGVPFRVVPRFMPELRLNDFLSEVELRRDTIYLEDGARAVEESRLTGWQSEIGATFRYSGKEMQPQPGGLSTHIRQVRDALWELTGVKYDSVLINYYADGKCGMRYHVDPLYDRWTPNSAVVSLGDTRTFIFRAINDNSTRWHYRVRNGDVVLMFDDCQDRLQHCVRVEKRADDAGPRMSLVFKERLRGPMGDYLLP